jgi:hypothetical protein
LQAHIDCFVARLQTTLVYKVHKPSEKTTKLTNYNYSTAAALCFLLFSLDYLLLLLLLLLLFINILVMMADKLIAYGGLVSWPVINIIKPGLNLVIFISQILIGLFT